MHILRGAKRLAREYYEFTKKPIGVTGEIAEFEAHRLLPHPEMWPFVTPLIGWRPSYLGSLNFRPKPSKTLNC